MSADKQFFDIWWFTYSDGSGETGWYGGEFQIMQFGFEDRGDPASTLSEQDIEWDRDVEIEAIKVSRNGTIESKVFISCPDCEGNGHRYEDGSETGSFDCQDCKATGWAYNSIHNSHPTEEQGHQS